MTTAVGDPGGGGGDPMMSPNGTSAAAGGQQPGSPDGGPGFFPPGGQGCRLFSADSRPEHWLSLSFTFHMRWHF